MTAQHEKAFRRNSIGATRDIVKKSVRCAALTAHLRATIQRTIGNHSGTDPAAPSPCAGSKCERSRRVRITDLMFTLASLAQKKTAIRPSFERDQR